MKPDTEAQIIAQCRSNPEAFSLIFDRWYKPLFGYLMRRTGNYDLARDLAAETFLKAFLKLDTFSWRGISISAWLYRIAGNELNQYYRHSKHQPQSLQQLLENPEIEKLFYDEADSERDMMEQELAAFEHYNLIRQNLLRLDVKYQEVVALRYFEQKTNAEICEILGKNEGTVKSLLSRGLEKLRKMM